MSVFAFAEGISLVTIGPVANGSEDLQSRFFLASVDPVRCCAVLEAWHDFSVVRKRECQKLSAEIPGREEACLIAKPKALERLEVLVEIADAVLFDDAAERDPDVLRIPFAPQSRRVREMLSCTLNSRQRFKYD